MANNFKNAIKTDISAVETAPTEVYYHATKKSIVIELDAANKSSAGVNISVAVEDTDQNGSALGSLSLTDHANGTFTRNSHGLDVNDRITIRLLRIFPYSYYTMLLPTYKHALPVQW